jgi:hypothetical protein
MSIWSLAALISLGLTLGFLISLALPHHFSSPGVVKPEMVTCNCRVVATVGNGVDVVCDVPGHLPIIRHEKDS